MSSLKGLKKRIRLVTNVAKVTKAMQVAASLKMRKAQELAISSRIFSHKLGEIAALVSDDIASPDNENIDLVLVGPDRGLCGSLLSNLQRGLAAWVKERGEENIRVICVNKKALIMAKRLGLNVVAVFNLSVAKTDQAEMSAIGQLIQNDIKEKKVGSSVVAFAHYENLMSQYFKTKQIFPMIVLEKKNEEEIREKLIEPSREEVYNSLVPRSMRLKLYQAILETAASEFSARAMAMKSASENAKDIAVYLTSQFNKKRQATITAQIAEVVGANLSS